MTVAIMQPYLFPYPGYFHLVHAADVFVHYGEAQYRKGGYVNRNRTDVSGRPTYFTLPVESGSLGDSIDARRVARKGYGPWRRKFLKGFRLAYAKTPHVDAALAMASAVLPETAPEGLTIGALARASTEAVARHTGLATATRLIDSDTLAYDRDADARDKVLSMCRGLGASDYVNASGGRALYDAADFAAAGLRLRFTEPLAEAKLPPGFRPELSILDAVARFDPETLSHVLSQYRLAE